jgi:hypothetical protein
MTIRSMVLNSGDITTESSQYCEDKWGVLGTLLNAIEEVRLKNYVDI